MSHEIIFARQAAKDFEALPAKVQEAVGAEIQKLSTAPRPSGCEKLEGEDDLYRIRSGDYRVI